MYPSRSGIGFSPRVGGRSAHPSPPSGQNLSAIAVQLESIEAREARCCSLPDRLIIKNDPPAIWKNA
jgi:hypothetical protein